MNAFKELEDGVTLSKFRELSKLEKQGIIQGFEYTHELAWNTIKDYLTEQGISSLVGSKDSTREAFKRGLLHNGEIWMDMIKARNLTSHTYDEALAEEVFRSITEDYYAALKEFCIDFKKLLEQNIS